MLSTGRRPIARSVLLLVAAGGLLALLFFHGPDWGLVAKAVGGVSWGWAAIAVAFNLLSALARGCAWRMVVVKAFPPPHPRYLDLFSAFFIGIFANGILPGRVGEVARVGVLARHLPERSGLWPALLGSVLAHRLLEVLPSFSLIVWVLLEAKLSFWAFGSLVLVLAAGSGLLVLGLFGARRHEQGTIPGLRAVRAVFEAVRVGLGVLRAPLPAALAAGLQLVAWGLQLAAVWTAMRAFHLSLPLIAAGLVLALMNVALLLPLWPGNVGLQQTAIALPLVSYGVAYGRGFAYGIGLQAIESSVGYVLGLAFLVREGLSLGALRAFHPREEMSTGT